MNRAARTSLAYLIAPVAGPVAMAIPAAFTAQAAGARLNTFAQAVLIGCMTSYPLSWVFGTLVFLILRRVRRETYSHYAISAAAAGACYAFVIGYAAPRSEVILVAAIFAAVALPVGLLFRAIRGADRR